MPPTLHPIRASPPPIVRPGGENHIRSDLSAGEKFNGLLVSVCGIRQWRRHSCLLSQRAFFGVSFLLCALTAPARVRVLMAAGPLFAQLMVRT